jgi:hypothetical protein
MKNAPTLFALALTAGIAHGEFTDAWAVPFAADRALDLDLLPADDR